MRYAVIGNALYRGDVMICTGDLLRLYCLANRLNLRRVREHVAQIRRIPPMGDAQQIPLVVS